MSREGIKVIVRLRPLNTLEMEQGGESCVQFDSKSISIHTTEKIDFTFDRVFGPNSTQLELFDEVALPIIDGVMNGYNGCIFAYGQTSSGKTFTMEGPDNPSEENKGLIPKAMNQIFEFIDQADDDYIYTVRVSFLEIYNEKINDLLDTYKTNLQIKEDRLRGLYVHNLTEVVVTNPEEMKAVMATGSTNRTIAATRMNERSSRSHSLFQVRLNVKNLKTDSNKASKLYFVDLAGSEKVAKTHVSGQQLEEAKNINKSLTCLGMVINALTSEKKEHIPYRDSKLTRILSESIGGNSKTTLVVACSMCSYNDKETLSSLRFGSRAKNIKNKPIVNQERSAKELQLLLDIANQKINEQEEIIKELTNETKDYSSDAKKIMQDSGHNQKNNSLKLLKLHLQVVNLTEENERLQTDLSAKELQIQNRIEEYNDKIIKMKKNDENLKLELGEALRKNQKLILENESLKIQLQESDNRFQEFKRNIQDANQDITFLMNSYQIKQFGSSDTESTRDIMMMGEQFEREMEEKAFESIMKLQECISQLDKQLQNETGTQSQNSSQKKINKLEKSGGSQRFLSKTNSQKHILSESSKLLHLLENDNISFDNEDDIVYSLEDLSKLDVSLPDDEKKDEEIEIDNVLTNLCQKLDDMDNIVAVQELIQKQRNQIHNLQDKMKAISQNCITMKEQQHQFIATNKLKVQQLKQIYQKKKAELQQLNGELQKQIEDISCQFQQYKTQKEESVEVLQISIKQLQIALDSQKKLNQQMMPSDSPLSREFQLECTIKQMMNERNELYNSLQKVRQDNETLRIHSNEQKEQITQFEKQIQQLKLQQQEQALKGQIFRRKPFGAYSNARGSTKTAQGKHLNVDFENDDSRWANEVQSSRGVQISAEEGIKQYLTFNELKAAFGQNKKLRRESERDLDMGAIYGARSIVQRETQLGQGQHAFIPEEQVEDSKSGINDIIGQLDFYLSKADTHELGEVQDE